jgi:hypothetical protein
MMSATSGFSQDFDKYIRIAQVIELFSGVPTSIQLSQGWNETAFGRADTIGTLYNNVFSIMDFDGDYWEFGNGRALGCWGRRSYVWRRYFHPLISWIDHAYFLMVHAPNHCGRDWRFWCDNPVRYGRRGYWKKIKKTIIQYKLNRFDIYNNNYNNSRFCYLDNLSGN